MPEHDTFDLETAFAALEHDIAGTSVPPGPVAAVATARRRRRARIGAVAAAAVLVLGGAALGQGLGGQPSSVSPSSSLPTPAPLTAQALTSATRGWTAAWTSATPKTSHLKAGAVGRCLTMATAGLEATEPTRVSGNLLFSAGNASALATLVDFEGAGTRALTTWTSLTTDVDRCETATPARDMAWDGAQARSYGFVSATGETGHTWLVREGAAFGFIWISGAPAVVPPWADLAVARAVVAALEFRGSFHDVPGSSTGTSSGAGSVFVTSDAFAAALGSWASGWSATEGDPPTSLPCGADLETSEQFGESTDLGANGEQVVYGYQSESAASQKLSSFATRIRACPAYDVRRVPLSGGSSLVVATGAGSGQQVVWVVQQGRTLGLIHVPADDTAPPESVDAAIAKLILAALDSQQSTTSGPAQATTKARR